MEERVIKIALDKAKEWYKSGDENLKEIALKAFKEDELNDEPWKRIKTFEDACKHLGVKPDLFIFGTDGKEGKITQHIYKLWKLSIIRKALNEGHDPSYSDNKIFIPRIMICNDKDAEFFCAHNIDDYIINSRVNIGGRAFYVVGGYREFHDGYLLCLKYGLDYLSNPNIQLLGCKSKEIAAHMGKHFTKEIFEAIYGLYGEYTIVNENIE
jgi:hypothetical protein